MGTKKLGNGRKLDALMESARVASFYGDTKNTMCFLEKTAKLAEEVGDWDRRNRLKIHNGLWNMQVRNLESTASLLLDGIATFSCTEMCPYEDYLVYTFLCNTLHLPRKEMKSKILDGPEILILHQYRAAVTRLTRALYDCEYKCYLQAVVDIEPILIADRFLRAHAGYVMRELHVLGYKQFLDAYKSVQMDEMGKQFGVGIMFLEETVARYICAGRLSAKIDKVSGVIHTNRPDKKNANYRKIIKDGDLLLNRIQKLARVIDL